MKLKAPHTRLSGDSTATADGFILTCCVLLLSLWLADRNTLRLADASGQVEHTHRDLEGLMQLLAERVSFQLEVA